MAEKESIFIKGLSNAGRPAKYKTPEEILEVAAEYFDQVTTKSGVCKPTISGLCFYLGFESRQSFHDYMKKEEFTYALKTCHLFIQQCYEANLHTFNSSGSIFALKNIAGEFWKDRSEVEQTIKQEQPLFPDVSKDNGDK